VIGCGRSAGGPISAKAARRSAWPEARVVTAPTTKPLRFSTRAWPIKHSRASLPGLAVEAGVGIGSREMCIVGSPLAVKILRAIASRAGRFARTVLRRKLLGLAQASSNVPSTEKCSLDKKRLTSSCDSSAANYG